MSDIITIASIDVYLVETMAKTHLADATRTVEKIGAALIDVGLNDGTHGYGLTYSEVGGEAIREFILKSIAPQILGMCPLATEEIYNRIMPYMRGVGRKGLAYCAYSAVDIALWDIKGKMLGLPLYRLLGGLRNTVPIYASGGWTSYSDEELLREIASMVECGYDKIKVKVGVEGGTNLAKDVRRIKAIRDEVGPNIGIMIDANNVWTSAVAIQLANRLRDLDIMLFEEPVFADDIPGLVSFKQHTDIPLATGEHEYTRYGVRDLILAGACDYVQTDVTRCGGVTEMQKIISMSQAWNLLFAPHGMEYMHMHLLAAAANGVFLERLLIFEPVMDIIFPDAPKPRNGLLTIPNTPGLGLEPNMKRIRDCYQK